MSAWVPGGTQKSKWNELREKLDHHFDQKGKKDDTRCSKEGIHYEPPSTAVRGQCRPSTGRAADSGEQI